MIASHNPKQIREELSKHGEQAHILAELACSVQWDPGSTPVPAHKLKKLTPANQAISKQILYYKHSPDYSAVELHELASWCRDEFKLTEYDGRE